MKVSGFKYLVGQGVENIWKNRMMAFASFCVLLVSLLLVGMSVLFYMNLTSMIGGVEDKNEVIIYMDEGTTDQQLADFYYILVSYAKRLLMLNQVHNEQIGRSTLNTLQIQIAFTLFVGKGIRLVQNDTGIDCCIFSQLVQSGNRVLGDDLFIDVQHGRPGCNSAERILTVAFEEWSIELLPEGIVILPEETFLIRVFITEVRKDFSPAREIVVNIAVAIDIQPGQKQVLDKID